MSFPPTYDRSWSKKNKSCIRNESGPQDNNEDAQTRKGEGGGGEQTLYVTETVSRTVHTADCSTLTEHHVRRHTRLLEYVEKCELG